MPPEKLQKLGIVYLNKYRCLTTIFVLSITVALFLSFSPTSAQQSYPFSLLPADVYPTAKLYGAPASALQSITVAGHSTVKKAIRVTTSTSYIPLPYHLADQQIGLNIPINRKVTAGEVVEVTFWLRSTVSSGGQAITRFMFERNGGAWTRSYQRMLTLKPEWTKHQYRFKVVETYEPGKALLTFYLGYGPQRFDLGGLTLLALGPNTTLPPAATYAGREANAAWRMAAAQRIEQHRKGDFNITVQDTLGHTIPDATVQVKMLQHTFKFGTAAVASRVTDPHSSDSQNYRTKLTQLFNTAVLESDLRWEQWEDLNRRETHTLPAIQWLHDNDLQVRGHTLVWPSWQYLPPDVADLRNDKTALRNRINAHILEQATALRGKLTDWDVLNEPFNNHDLMDILGREEMAQWFKLTHQADPEVELAINDYNVIEERGEEYFRQNSYYNTITSLLDQGAPLHRVGFQSHFYGDMLTSPERILSIFNRFAALGLKLQVTEFDLATKDEQLQADYTRDFLTLAFSHPQVDSFLNWGFWEGEHYWSPEAAMFRKDWSIKPNGQVWQDLIYRQWWTDVNGRTNAAGIYKARGFLGDYQIDVVVGGKVNRYYVSLPKEGKDLVIKFDPNAPLPPLPPQKPLPPPDSTSTGLVNGSFEQGTNSWYCLGDCPLTTITNDVHSGSQALSIANRTTDWQGPAQDVKAKVKPGQSYTSSVWVKLAPGSAPTLASVQLKVQIVPGEPATYIPLGTATINDSGWTQITGTAVAQWSGTPSYIEWYIDTPGTKVSFIIDDAQLTPASNAI